VSSVPCLVGRAVGLLQPGDLGAGDADVLVEDAPRGVGHGAGGVGVVDLVVDEGIEEELLAHVLEIVLLPPALEHAVGDLDVAQVPATGDDLRLVPGGAQARDLAQPQFAVEEAHRLVVQLVRDARVVELRFA
jgi:hypothetical protein